jgi:hypothetical protein
MLHGLPQWPMNLVLELAICVALMSFLATSRLNIGGIEAAEWRVVGAAVRYALQLRELQSCIRQESRKASRPLFRLNKRTERLHQY